MKTLILIFKKAKPLILILSAILIVFFAIIISHCATTFAPMWFQFVWYSIGIGFMIWYIASALNGGRNIFQTNKNGWVWDRSSKGYGVLHTGTTICPEIKEVTLKVNGSLYIMNGLPENFSNQLIEGIAMNPGMKSFASKVEIDYLVLDRDIELFGDVYAQSIIIPNNVRFKVLCAGNFASSCSTKA